MNVEITRNVEDADIVIVHKNFAKGGAKILNTAQEYRIRIFYVKTNSMAQIQKVLKDALDIQPGDVEPLQGYTDDTEKALDEAKNAIKKVLEGAPHVELDPQNQHIRKLQHELIEQYNLKSEAIGDEPNRRIVITKLMSIVINNLRKGPCQLYEKVMNYKNKNKGFIVGEGVYLAPDVHEAEKYADKTKLGERKSDFQFMVMCRVKPDEIRDPGRYPINWVVDDNYDCLRPYRILVKET